MNQEQLDEFVKLMRLEDFLPISFDGYTDVTNIEKFSFTKKSVRPFKFKNFDTHTSNSRVVLNFDFDKINWEYISCSNGPPEDAREYNLISETFKSNVSYKDQTVDFEGSVVCRLQTDRFWPKSNLYSNHFFVFLVDLTRDYYSRIMRDTKELIKVDCEYFVKGSGILTKSSR